MYLYLYLQSEYLHLYLYLYTRYFAISDNWTQRQENLLLHGP